MELTQARGPQARRPRCSIIIPAYNAAPYLAEAIDSALAQTYEPLEVVVVDDGSTDGTPAVLAAYGERIVAVHKVNGGCASARNAGLEVATGDIVGFLDADDTFVPTRMERCVDLLVADPSISMVTTDATMVDGHQRTEKRWYGDFTRPEFPPPDDQLATLTRWNFVYVSAVLWRRVFDELGPFDDTLRRSEDYEMWLRMQVAGHRFALIREPLAESRRLPDSLLEDREKQWDAHLTALGKHLPALRRAGVAVPGGICFDVARRAARRGALGAAAAAGWMGLRAGDLPLGRRLRAGAALARESLGRRRAVAVAEQR
jgi:glycosyltransferase involved in cell wall biosynthesis